LAAGMTFNHDCIILDASCLISLYATKQMAPILRSIPNIVAVAAFVYEKEALWIYGGPEHEVRQSKEPIDLLPMVQAGLVEIVDIASEAEIERQVNLEANLDPGEAISGAIALSRNWAIALDERKARNLFSHEAAHIQLIYTLELVKHWCDTRNPPFETIAAALKNIRHRAIYKPGPNHPLHDWWIQYLPE